MLRLRLSVANMQYKLFVLTFLAAIAFTSAVPSLMVEDEEGNQYHLTPVLSRQRREGPQGFGQGGADRRSQGGVVGFTNPNGSGGSVGYGHYSGQGHTASVDGRVPVWSGKNRFGETTLNVGGGATQHFGGPGGNRNLDKRVGASINHRW